MQIHVSRTIPAAPEQVFAAATDVVGAPRRIDGIESTELLTDGPVGLGTRFRETRVMFGKEATEEMEVVGFDPPRSWSLAAESCGCKYLTEIRFVPDGAGTRIEMDFGGEPQTFLARIMGAVMAPLMRGTMVKCLEQDLESLERSLARDASE